MEGENRMELNEAMIKIVQFYFDAHLFANGKFPLVEGVSGNSNNGFRIDMSEKPQN